MCGAFAVSYHGVVFGYLPFLTVSGVQLAWEKQVLSARGYKRVGRHSEYAI
jgi:hypothetical protein